MAIEGRGEIVSFDNAPHSNDRLRSWKEIAAFLSCDLRTAKRWEESRGLPVRRLQMGPRSGVFAFRSELQAWLREKEPAISPEPADATVETGLSLGMASKAIAGMNRYFVTVGLVLVFAVAGAAVGLKVGQAGFGGRNHVPSAEAQAFYRAGAIDWQTRNPASLTRAVDEFTQAIVRDPQYAAAYAGLANCYNLLREYTAMPAAFAFPRAKAAAERAIALDPSLADAHTALAFADFYWSYDSKNAATEFQRAIALQPDNATVHHWYAGFLAMRREFPKALAEIEKARALDPESSSILADKALILFDAGEDQKAAKQLRQLEQASPEFFSPHAYLVGVDLVQGDYKDFLRESASAAKLREDVEAQTLIEAGKNGLAGGGRIGMFAAMLKLELQSFDQGKSDAYSVARLQADVGNVDEMLAYLKLSLTRHETMAVSLDVAPEFRPFRNLPAFRRLAKQSGISASMHI